MASTSTSDSDSTPEIGLITWDSEGMEAPGNRFHSRVLHVPTEGSGLTLGRGYDMKERNAAEISRDLVAAGVAAADAATIGRAAGLFGADARKFIADNRLDKFEIAKLTQKNLFISTYNKLKADVVRISAKPDVVAAYGACDWLNIQPPIVDLVVDLRFRGDYTGTTRALVQKGVAGNDLAGLTQAMKVVASWANVPTDRRQRRIAFLDKALAAQRPG